MSIVITILVKHFGLFEKISMYVFSEYQLDASEKGRYLFTNIPFYHEWKFHTVRGCVIKNVKSYKVWTKKYFCDFFYIHLYSLIPLRMT